MTFSVILVFSKDVEKISMATTSSHKKHKGCQMDIWLKAGEKVRSDGSKLYPGINNCTPFSQPSLMASAHSGH